MQLEIPYEPTQAQSPKLAFSSVRLFERIAPIGQLAQTITSTVPCFSVKCCRAKGESFRPTYLVSLDEVEGGYHTDKLLILLV